MKALRYAVSTLTLLFALGANSVIAEGVGVASASVVDDASSAPTLAKVGEAKLSVMFWDVYESSLYTADGNYQAGVRPLRLEIRYLRDIAAKDLVKQTGKEWRAQGIEFTDHDEWLNELLTLWPDVSEGDVIALAIDASGRATFEFNGAPLGSIEDPRFGEDFAGIWLSPNTTRPELRAALIGGNQNDNADTRS